jgi:1-phosphofructokinase
MILTVTLNPSLDRTVEVERVTLGEVLRAQAVHLDPGGKGVNVSRALLANGVPSRAILPVGGAEGDQLIALLRAEQVDTVIVPVAGRTRSNITVAEADGTVTKLNEPGATLTAEELEVVTESVLAEAAGADWVAICGSLPPGVSPDQYGVMVRRFRQAGLRVAVDTSGQALLGAVAAGPDLIKPNADELAAAVGHSLRSWREVVGAARSLQSAGARTVLVSMGAAGAVLVDEQGFLVGAGEAVTVRSTVGAGDACLAGFLGALCRPGVISPPAQGSARLVDREGPLAQALAWGAAAVQLPGSRMPGPDEIDLGGIHLLKEADLQEPLVGVS